MKSKIDTYVINKIRRMRLKRKVMQIHIADELGFSRGWIAQIENPDFAATYSVRDLGILAEYFECSPKDFLPDTPL